MCDPSLIPVLDNVYGEKSTAKRQALPANEGMRNFSSEPSSNLKIKLGARNLKIEIRMHAYRVRFHDHFRLPKNKKVACAT